MTATAIWAWMYYKSWVLDSKMVPVQPSKTPLMLQAPNQTSLVLKAMSYEILSVCSQTRHISSVCWGFVHCACKENWIHQPKYLDAASSWVEVTLYVAQELFFHFSTTFQHVNNHECLWWQLMCLLWGSVPHLQALPIRTARNIRAFRCGLMTRHMNCQFPAPF